MSGAHSPHLTWDDCFCQVDFGWLARLARQHYMEGVSTVELPRQCADENDRRAAIAVAMLDLSDEELLRQCRLTGNDCAHMLECASATRSCLVERGITIPSKHSPKS